MTEDIDYGEGDGNAWREGTDDDSYNRDNEDYGEAGYSEVDLENEQDGMYDSYTDDEDMYSEYSEENLGDEE